ncbi:SDR family NAD(P)-dependent oxidoreductase [Halomonas urumqiensis]|uniref:2-deoxy-D-gluconate 3-dehydrogenase n=1 Tax=Halomonas urumqiensis TaxID=1684789 RepID=A0A2N7UMV0_9GAMM|nr:SDR family oxidoreductase [Halomonas urumqiensis]PMR81729.1 2-deoxy-D-gluconate 3-dehydrogenase [Halomonas urumqiensis]PTB02366.1 KR domain-containing protein [Halomonas urumqiensis]GHE21846.1 short-chain dehydrogenase [Halomonas urumqiensis]
MRTVVVVGGSSGIGQAIAEGFAGEGARVNVTGIEAEPSRRQHRDIGYTQLDVSDSAAVTRYFGHFTHLDVLVNCAGVIRRGGAEFTPDGFAEVVNINLNGTQRCCQAALPALRAASGCVINTASMLSYFGSGQAPAYAASKGGVAQLTKSLAIAWAAEGVRVNALAPGWIATDLTAPLTHDDARSAELVGRTPMGRWGVPEDLVGPALFLASPEAAFVTGVLLPVDGGYAAR